VISAAFKTPLKNKLENLYLHRPDEYIGFTPSCLPHILQQNCAHVYVAQTSNNRVILVSGL